MINKTGLKLTDIYHGTDKISKIYHGDDIVYKKGGFDSSKYQKVKYIQSYYDSYGGSTSCQWIDTGIEEAANRKFHISFTTVANRYYLSNHFIMGNKNDMNAYMAVGLKIGGGINGSADNLGIKTRYANYGDVIVGGRVNNSTAYHYDLTFNSVPNAKKLTGYYVDQWYYEQGQSAIDSRKTTVNITGRYNDIVKGNILLFNATTDTSGSYRSFPIMLYEYNVYDGDTLIQNLIPCYRRSDGEIGLYDEVSGKFFTNQGLRKFTKGADVND